MIESELREFVIDELQTFVDEKLSDIDYWVERFEEGDLTRDDFEIMRDEIFPYSQILLVTE